MKLQGRYVDVSYAHRQIESVKETLQTVRCTVDSFHDLVYKEALVLASSVDVDESVPRFASRQHRQNIPSDNAKEYYKRTSTIQMLDFPTTELNSCFDAAASHNIAEIMHLLPSQQATSAGYICTGYICIAETTTITHLSQILVLYSISWQHFQRLVVNAKDQLGC